MAAPNFSTGVAAVRGNRGASGRLLGTQREFGAWLHEAHHDTKKDAPSGTALTLKRAMEPAGFSRPIDVSSTRAGFIPGMHTDRVRRPGGYDHADPHGARSHGVRPWRADCGDMGARQTRLVHHARRARAFRGRAGGRDNDHEDTIYGSRVPHSSRRLPGTATSTRRASAASAGGRSMPASTFWFRTERPAKIPRSRSRSAFALSRFWWTKRTARCRFSPGAGGYNTKEVVHLADEMRKAGAYGLLSVTPYYNKPTPEGLVQHFRAIADCDAAADRRLQRPGTHRRQHRRPHVRAPGGDSERRRRQGSVRQRDAGVRDLRAVPSDFFVLSGDDALTLPLMAVGGRGVISVVSNEIPKEMSQMVEAAERNDFAAARDRFMRASCR